MMRLRLLSILAVILLAIGSLQAQRRISPVTSRDPGTAAPVEKVKEKIDPSRLVTTTDAQGHTVTVDTVTGREYVDSAMLAAPPKMEYPLLYTVIAGVNVWDPLMRALGQKYGLGDVWAELNLHNRYFPFFAFGMGDCTDTPVDKNFTYRSPLSPYFKLGASYNFFYNSNPDYKFQAGLRYGFSPFRWSLSDVTVDEGYWDGPSTYSLPSMSHSAGYLEITFGLKVKIAGPISMGWTLLWHSVLHESASPYGKPMYIPGYGKRNGRITANLSIMYTIPLKQKDSVNKTTLPEVNL